MRVRHMNGNIPFVSEIYVRCSVMSEVGRVKWPQLVSPEGTQKVLNNCPCRLIITPASNAAFPWSGRPLLPNQNCFGFRPRGLD